jgi:hypothetical protein
MHMLGALVVRSPRAVRASNGVVARSSVARCYRQVPVGPGGGIGQGGGGRSTPERWVNGEAVQVALVAAFNGSGGALMVGSDEGVALQLREGREG